ncbi:MAG: mechanosensitive ion channel [Agathobacter sp.]|nr:mechanosensitive ion channel [Agathobacter sp.]
MRFGLLTEAGTEIFSMTEAEEVLNDVTKNPGILKTYFQDKLPEVISFLIKVAIALLIFWIGTRIIKAVVKLIRRSMERHGTEVGVTSFLCTLIHYALDFVLVMFILSGFGLSGTIVAVLGSAGLTVGLALQGSLSNFAGGVLIILLKPFVVGDYIIDSASGKEGTVADVSVFYTRLLTIDNKMINIPNGTLSNATIINVSKMENRRVDLVIGVAYESDLSKVKAVLENIARTDEAVMQDEPIDVFVDELADSSVNMGLRVWVKNADYWTTRWRLQERIKNAFDEHNISIPFPQVEINMKQ